MKNPFLSLIFVIIAVGNLRADVDVDSLIQNSPPPSRYPEAGACILLYEETDSILEDGGYVKEIHRVIKIFDYRGKKEYSNVKVRYNREKERVDLLFARTYRTDGTVVEIDSGAINEITLLVSVRQEFVPILRRSSSLFPLSRTRTRLSNTHTVSRASSHQKKDIFPPYSSFAHTIRSSTYDIGFPHSLIELF